MVQCVMIPGLIQQHQLFVVNLAFLDMVTIEIEVAIGEYHVSFI